MTATELHTPRTWDTGDLTGDAPREVFRDYVCRYEGCVRDVPDGSVPRGFNADPVTCAACGADLPPFEGYVFALLRRPSESVTLAYEGLPEVRLRAAAWSLAGAGKSRPLARAAEDVAMIGVYRRAIAARRSEGVAA